MDWKTMLVYITGSVFQHARRLRHRHLAVDPLEYVWCLHEWGSRHFGDDVHSKSLQDMPRANCAGRQFRPS